MRNLKIILLYQTTDIAGKTLKAVILASLRVLEN